jgi:hypothetical protein
MESWDMVGRMIPQAKTSGRAILSGRHGARKPFEEWESLGKGLVQRVFRRIGLQRLL